MGFQAFSSAANLSKVQPSAKNELYDIADLWGVENANLNVFDFFHHFFQQTYVYPKNILYLYPQIVYT